MVEILCQKYISKKQNGVEGKDKLSSLEKRISKKYLHEQNNQNITTSLPPFLVKIESDYVSKMF